MKGSRPNLLIDFNMKTLILVSQNGMVRQIPGGLVYISESRPGWGHIKSFTFRNYYAK